MRLARLVRVAAALATSALVLVPAQAVTARTLVDPTSLTPPMRPDRVCWEEGVYVRCDTSDHDTWEGVPVIDAPCGTVYEAATDDSNATRYYLNGLIVRRQVQDHFSGTWSLDPAGGGRTVTVASDTSWDERFTTPGDIDSGVTSFRGSGIRVPALGVEVHTSGIDLPDGTHHGVNNSNDVGFLDICAALQ